MRLQLLLGAVTALSACNVTDAQEGMASPATGNGGSRSFVANGFDQVSLRGPDNVVVRVGAAESVTATGDTEVLDQLEIQVVDGQLRVARKGINGVSWNRDNKRAEVTVTVPQLRAASVAGSGDMTVDRAQAASFEAEIAGSGSLRIATLQADAASLRIAGSGGATVGGSARSLDVAIAGSGDLDAGALKSERASISIAGAGNVRAGVDGEADISILGSGDVEIIGKASCKISKMGSGDVRCSG